MSARKSNVTPPRQADRDRRRTARSPEGQQETDRQPQPPASPSTKDECLRRYLPRALRHRSAMLRPSEGGAAPRSEGPSASLHPESYAEYSAIRRVALSRGRESDRDAGTSVDRGRPFQAPTGCVQGPPCDLIAAILRSGRVSPELRRCIDQFSSCSLPGSGLRSFECKNREACFAAHRLSHLLDETPKKRGIARLLSAFLDLIFGRRA